MSAIDMGDAIIAAAGLALVGVGLWWHDPGWSLAVVGSLLFGGSVLAQLVKRRKPPDA